MADIIKAYRDRIGGEAWQATAEGGTVMIQRTSAWTNDWRTVAIAPRAAFDQAARRLALNAPDNRNDPSNLALVARLIATGKV